MVKNGCTRIDFGCNCMVVLQPCLCLLHLVVTIAMGLLCCDSYMLIATGTLIVVAKWFSIATLFWVVTVIAYCNEDSRG
jgi:hypothetical protein